MTRIADAELLRRFRSGDEIALEALFERYESALFPFLLGLLRDHHLAEDTLQNTFIKALERSGDAAPEKFRSWLFSVAYQEAMLTRRKRKYLATTTEDATEFSTDPHLPPDELSALRDDQAKLLSLLSQLPQAQQQVIRARIYEGKRFREIAAELGCPLNTTLARMHEGLKRLRALWEQKCHG